MVYPDGEKIVYDYDLGGNLNKMTGDYNGSPYSYIERIDYDFYEQRTYLLYGNKTETFYNYTPALRRLENLNVKTYDGNDLFNNKYAYDKVGNVLGLSSSAEITANNMAGKYDHKFEYDNLNRLVGAEGAFDGGIKQIDSGNDANASYNLIMKYTDTHGILNKTQQHIKNGNAYIQNTYNNDYKYITDTHKVETIVDGNTGEEEHFKYDLNGNITMRETTSLHRDFSWDESNRLRVVADNRAMQHYIYDASGERVLKANSDVEALYQNGTLVNAPGTVSINGYTSYPSAFIVINADGVYSKHYYAGSQRIVSRLGDNGAGIFEVGLATPRTAGNGDDFDAKKLQQAQKNDLQSHAGKLKRGTIVYKDYKPVSLAEQEKALADENEDKVEARAPSVYPMYFYHPDHLGTSTALTDFNGNAYQFFLNLPFGETMAEQLGSNYFNTPYKFNGKELDEETGLYFYGARYYDPKISVWMSVDPLAEKYPNANPYNYCLQNPINLIDPTGMSPEGEFEKDKDGKWQKTSTVGDAIGVDFYHSNDTDKQGNQITYITDREGNWNIIRNGRDVFRDGEIRSNDIEWLDIYNEWDEGTGPRKSIFEGMHPNNVDIHNSYLYKQEESLFHLSGAKKKGVEIDFGMIEFINSAQNMQAQMMGSYNLSFYKLGDNVLNIAQDSKSRTSFYYHLPWINNHDRGLRRIWNLKGYQEVDDRESNTFQTYIFMTTRK